MIERGKLCKYIWDLKINVIKKQKKAEAVRERKGINTLLRKQRNNPSKMAELIMNQSINIWTAQTLWDTSHAKYANIL